jgi:hypothetical protein
MMKIQGHFTIDLRNGGMTMTTLREALDGFVSKGLGGTKKYRGTVRNLLLGKDEGAGITDKDRETYVLVLREEISGCLDLPLDAPVVQENLRDAIKESVKSYTNTKATAIETYKRFLSHVELKYGVSFDMDFPPVFSSEFDRQMFIVKELHEAGRGVSHLEDRLWISSRTLEEDLSKLQDRGEISVLGQEVSIRGIERDNGTISFQSTVHPLFLTPNLTQVVVMLNGLRVMSGDRAYRNYALHLASTIWKELSEYGRNRILGLTEELSLDRVWYEKISHLEGEALFQTERECSNDEGAGNVLDFLKNRKDCCLAYTNEAGEECLLLDVRIERLEQGHIIASKDGREHRIEISRIKKSVRDRKLLY